MKPCSFDYVRPQTVAEALTALSSDPDAKVIAGGQSLVPLMNFRLAAPTLLVDIADLDELDFIWIRGDQLCIGARVRQRAVERSTVAASSCGLLGQALRWIGHPQIRNRGTICGSLVHGDPSAELPAVAVATGAEFVVRSVSGERIVAAADFFEAPMWTAVEEGELVTEVRFPLDPPGALSTVREYARRSGDFAIAGIAMRGHVAENPAGVRIAAFGVAHIPIRMTAVETAIAAGQSDSDALERAVHDDIPTPTDDGQADGGYRLDLVRHLLSQALVDCGGPR